MAAPSSPTEELPFCGNCGYSFAGLTNSSKCPECGRPIVDVLTRPTFARRRSVRYRSTATFMGVPLVCVALGPVAGERFGRAVGVVAVGELATGVVAAGLVARGVLAFGTVSIGIVSFGSLAIGVVALGGASIGALAAGGVAVGGVAIGGCAVGWLRAIGGATYKIPL